MILFAEYDEDEQFLTFRDVVQSSGNSTVQVVVMDPALEAKGIRALFDTLGCSSVEFQERNFVIDVPATLSYRPVKSLLDELFANDSIDYAEACLSDKHGSETD